MPPAKAATANTATAVAMRAASELAAALIVGGVLGYWLDKWLDTKPLFMILLFFAGFVAGFMNIYRAQTGKTFKMQDNLTTHKTDTDTDKKEKQ